MANFILLEKIILKLLPHFITMTEHIKICTHYANPSHIWSCPLLVCIDPAMLIMHCLMSNILVSIIWPIRTVPSASHPISLGTMHLHSPLYSSHKYCPPTHTHFAVYHLHSNNSCTKLQPNNVLEYLFHLSHPIINVGSNLRFNSLRRNFYSANKNGHFLFDAWFVWRYSDSAISHQMMHVSL